MSEGGLKVFGLYLKIVEVIEVYNQMIHHN